MKHDIVIIDELHQLREELGQKMLDADFSAVDARVLAQEEPEVVADLLDFAYASDAQRKHMSKPEAGLAVPGGSGHRGGSLGLSKLVLASALLAVNTGAFADEPDHARLNRGYQPPSVEYRLDGRRKPKKAKRKRVPGRV